MDSSQILEELARLLQVDSIQTPADVRLDAHDRWDSLAIIGLMAYAQNAFDIELDSGELQRAQTAADILAMLDHHSSRDIR